MSLDTEKLKEVLQSPLPAVFHVRTHQVTAPDKLNAGVTLHVVALQLASDSVYQILNEVPLWLIHRYYNVELVTLSQVKVG